MPPRGIPIPRRPLARLCCTSFGYLNARLRISINELRNYLAKTGVQITSVWFARNCLTCEKCQPLRCLYAYTIQHQLCVGLRHWEEVEKTSEDVCLLLRKKMIASLTHKGTQSPLLLLAILCNTNTNSYFIKKFKLKIKIKKGAHNSRGTLNCWWRPYAAMPVDALLDRTSTFICASYLF